MADMICPLFTAALLAGNAMKPKSSIIPSAGLPQPITPPEQEAVPCAGPMCQWWQPIVDPKTGKVVDGDCTVKMATKQINAVSNILASLIQANAAPVVPSKH